MKPPLDQRVPRPSVMGVVNVTPDSFSDGGVNFHPGDAAASARLREASSCLDAGIGLGKTVGHNFELLRRLDELTALGRPILIGISRKSSLGKIMGDPNAKTGTTAASVGAAVLAYERGASIFRAHDVYEHVEALTAARAIVAR